MIEARLEIWEGSKNTELDADGTYRVFTGSKHDTRNLVATGDANAGVVRSRADAATDRRLS
jgi:hypothetical protein